jgi:L-ascorbate metabolism protein UlaG (beta-lactamase superfamily)
MSCAGSGQRGVAPGQTERIGSIKISGVPSYNVTKRFHPKSGAWLGYLVEVDGIRIYHAGDTDPLPDMYGLRPDIALLPVGGMFTMNWKAAAELVSDLGATLAIPMHFNALIGGKRTGERFAAAVGAGGLVLPRTR